jgi:hypothetical protein
MGINPSPALALYCARDNGAIGTDLFPVTIVKANLPALINRGSRHKVYPQGSEQKQSGEEPLPPVSP